MITASQGTAKHKEKIAKEKIITAPQGKNQHINEKKNYINDTLAGTKYKMKFKVVMLHAFSTKKL